MMCVTLFVYLFIYGQSRYDKASRLPIVLLGCDWALGVECGLSQGCSDWLCCGGNGCK